MADAAGNGGQQGKGRFPVRAGDVHTPERTHPSTGGAIAQAAGPAPAPAAGTSAPVPAAAKALRFPAHPPGESAAPRVRLHLTPSVPSLSSWMQERGHVPRVHVNVVGTRNLQTLLTYLSKKWGLDYEDSLTLNLPGDRNMAGGWSAVSAPDLTLAELWEQLHRPDPFHLDYAFLLAEARPTGVSPAAVAAGTGCTSGRISPESVQSLDPATAAASPEPLHRYDSQAFPVWVADTRVGASAGVTQSLLASVPAPEAAAAAAATAALPVPASAAAGATAATAVPTASETSTSPNAATMFGACTESRFGVGGGSECWLPMVAGSPLRPSSFRDSLFERPGSEVDPSIGWNLLQWPPAELPVKVACVETSSQKPALAATGAATAAAQAAAQAQAPIPTPAPAPAAPAPAARPGAPAASAAPQAAGRPRKRGPAGALPEGGSSSRGSSLPSSPRQQKAHAAAGPRPCPRGCGRLYKVEARLRSHLLLCRGPKQRRPSVPPAPAARAVAKATAAGTALASAAAAAATTVAKPTPFRVTVSAPAGGGRTRSPLKDVLGWASAPGGARSAAQEPFVPFGGLSAKAGLPVSQVGARARSSPQPQPQPQPQSQSLSQAVPPEFGGAVTVTLAPSTVSASGWPLLGQAGEPGVDFSFARSPVLRGQLGGCVPDMMQGASGVSPYRGFLLSPRRSPRLLKTPVGLGAGLGSPVIVRSDDLDDAGSRPSAGSGSGSRRNLARSFNEYSMNNLGLPSRQLNTERVDVSDSRQLMEMGDFDEPGPKRAKLDQSPTDPDSDENSTLLRTLLRR